MTQTHAEATLPFDDAIAAFDPVMGLEVHVELSLIHISEPTRPY